MIERPSLFHLIGFSMLAVGFTTALCVVLFRSLPVSHSKRVTIRFAHWQLEGGVRGAYDEIIQAYEKLHPEVEVIQMLIPERVYATWATTQLIGQTAPDLIELSSSVNSDERLVRYFLPLTEWASQPNPYNQDTSLVGVPWGDTFIDGLTAPPNFNPNLLEIYGIPCTTITTRVYYNKDLYRKIVGSGKVPENYAEFIDVCRRIEKRGESVTGHRIIPMAGSKYNAPRLTSSLFRSQTQKLWASMQGDDLRTSDSDPNIVRFAFLKGQISFDQPEIRSGLDMLCETAQFMPPGFLQLNRDDATFMFAQQKTVMIVTGSFDYKSIQCQAPFEIGAFRLPIPTRDDPVYGKYTLGMASEAGNPTEASFGVTNNSRHVDETIDFLRFLTSQRMNQLFSRKSGWMPSVLGVSVAGDQKIFEPVLEGYIDGFRLDLNTDTQRVININSYRLVGGDDGVGNFIERVKSDYRGALKSEILRANKIAFQNIARLDVPLAAYAALSRRSPNGRYEAKRSELDESQTLREIKFYDSSFELDELDARRMEK